MIYEDDEIIHIDASNMFLKCKNCENRLRLEVMSLDSIQEDKISQIFGWFSIKSKCKTLWFCSNVCIKNSEILSRYEKLKYNKSICGKIRRWLCQK